MSNPPPRFRPPAHEWVDRVMRAIDGADGNQPLIREFIEDIVLHLTVIERENIERGRRIVKLEKNMHSIACYALSVPQNDQGEVGAALQCILNNACVLILDNPDYIVMGSDGYKKVKMPKEMLWQPLNRTSSSTSKRSRNTSKTSPKCSPRKRKSSK